MSRRRGTNLQEALAAYLRANGWPSAESVPNGRRGADILGTPGVAFENKTADEWDVLDWVRQAKANAGARDVPVVVYWPRRVGAGSVGQTLAILPIPYLTELLRTAGYGNPHPR
jgi:hypothetical protein